MTLTNTEFDIFIGSKIGSFKHVKYNPDLEKKTKKCVENLQDLSSLNEDDGITCMSWGNKEQTEILIGRKNQQVQIYNVASGAFTDNLVANYDKGHIKGLCRVGDSLVTALESGVVKIWNDTSTTIVTGENLGKMRQSPFDENILATGGKENDLKLWNVASGKRIFNAKNVAHDWLQLRVPIWPSDVCFLPESDGKVVAVCTRHGFIRLYDTRAQRRPICTVEFKELPATCMTSSHMERHVVVGFGRGQLHQVDLRGKGKPDKGYKGCVGAVTDIFTIPQGPYVVSTSLDRYLRVHHADTKKLIHKEYLTSKLTNLLVQTEGSTPMRDTIVKQEDAVQEQDDKETVEVLPPDEEYEAMFDEMERIGESKRTDYKRKKASVDVDTTDKVSSVKKKKKKDAEVGADSERPATLDDSIKRLLTSTEKTKRTLEKRKKKKRSQSVFYNT